MDYIEPWVLFTRFSTSRAEINSRRHDPFVVAPGANAVVNLFDRKPLAAIRAFFVCEVFINTVHLTSTCRWYL